MSDDSPPGEATTVYVSMRHLADEHVRAYHWSPTCARAPARTELVEVPLAAAERNPRLRACRSCAPRP